MTSTLERRVEQLRRQTRHARLLNMLLIVLAVPTLGVVGWHYNQTRNDDVLRTGRLEILNNDGLPVVIIDTNAEGGVISTLYNTGATSSLLGVEARSSDASLTLFADEGHRTSVLGTFGDETRGLLTFTSDGQIAAALGADAQNQPSLRLMHSDQDRLRLVASSAGGELWAWNNSGSRVFQIGTSPIGNGQIVASNEHGTPIFKIGSSMAGAGFLQTFNEFGTELVRLGSTTSGTGLVLTSHLDGTAAVQLTSTSTGQGALSIHPLNAHSATLTFVPSDTSSELE